MSSFLPELLNPTPTKQKREQRFRKLVDWKQVRPAAEADPWVEIPGLDTARLSAQYGMDNAVRPTLHRCTFQAPLGATWEQYEKIRDAALEKWFGVMAKQGWDLYATETYRMRVYPGVYPAHDLLSGTWILDRREFIAEAYFRYQNPKPLRIELPPHLVEPIKIRR